jgi:thiamine-phosphate pyrophosphorylase
MILPRFYPIFDSADWLERMLPLGIKLVQLRVKDRTDAETRAEIRRARDISRQHGALLVVNDYWQIAMDEGCDWIHLGQEDLDTADLKAIRAAGLKVGVSTHDEEELARAMAVAPDYVALGPIWPTILKKMKWHQQGVEKLADWKARIGDIPLIAIGGLKIERAGLAFDAGADVVSVVTDITLDALPEEKVRQWLAATA